MGYKLAMGGGAIIKVMKSWSVDMNPKRISAKSIEVLTVIAQLISSTLLLVLT